MKYYKILTLLKTKILLYNYIIIVVIKNSLYFWIVKLDQDVIMIHLFNQKLIVNI